MTGGKKKRDFTQTTSACLSFIQEALLKHRWQQAADYMHSYLQTLEDSDTFKRQAAPEVGTVAAGSCASSSPHSSPLSPLPCFLGAGVTGVPPPRLIVTFLCQCPAAWNATLHASIHQCFLSACMCFCVVLAIISLWYILKSGIVDYMITLFLIS